MIISTIVAVSENNVIGKDNNLPWRLSNDLKYFKKTTQGHTIVLGRKNYDSIGRPLPNRTNIVITRQSDLKIEGCIVMPSLESAIEYAKANGEDELFIIGGAQIYALAIPLINKLYLTKVHADVEGDVVFPEMGEGWKEVSSEDHKADEKNEFDHSFVVYEKI